MGFSPGEFKDLSGNEFHWEGKSRKRIVLWNADESTAYIWLSPEEAKKAASQLMFLAELAEADGL